MNDENARICFRYGINGRCGEECPVFQDGDCEAEWDDEECESSWTTTNGTVLTVMNS